MSEGPTEGECGNQSPAPANAIKVKGASSAEKRHVIKARNIKPLLPSAKTSSPLTKSLDLFGKLSRSRMKEKKQLTLDDSFGGISPETDGKTQKADVDKNDTRLGPSPSCSTYPSENESKGSKMTQPSMQKTNKNKASNPSKRSSKVKSHVLTEYYPVRRSSRKTKTILEKEENESIIKAIAEKREDGLSVVDFEGKGRGVVAKRPFKKGAFVVEYSGDLIDWNEAKQREEKYAKDPTVGCYMYYFVHERVNYCVDATAESGRLGRLLNHSRKNPNCKTKLVTVSNSADGMTAPRLVIIAKRDIALGEELTYDYGDRDKETLRSHPWLKST